MAKSELPDELIPDTHTSESLNALADFFDAAARQVRFAAKDIEDRGIDVVGTPTLRVGYRHVRNWIGNLFQAISSVSLEKAVRNTPQPKPPAIRQSDAELADTEAAKLRANIKSPKKTETKRKAE